MMTFKNKLNSLSLWKVREVRGVLKLAASNPIQQSFFSENVIDPMREYEDFILNEICPNPDNMTYEQMLELGEKVGTVERGLDKKQIEKLKKIVFSKKLSSNQKIPDRYHPNYVDVQFANSNTSRENS
jgi:hypothetical protein